MSVTQNTNKTLRGISKLQVKPPRKERVKKACFDDKTRDDIDTQSFRDDVIDAWRERSVEVINFHVGTNTDEVTVIERDRTNYAVASYPAAILRDVIDVVDEYSVDVFDIEELENIITSDAYMDSRYLMEDFDVENDTAASDHVINELTYEFVDTLTFPVNRRKMTTHHGDFFITHCTRIE